jgi:DNA replication protein DnaC
MPAECPDGRCDGSGFLYDEAARRAYPCSCRPARLARRKAAAVAGRIPARFRGVSFDREPVPSIERTNPWTVRAVREYVTGIDEALDAGRGIWFAGDVGTGKTTLAMLISKAAMDAGRTVAIYSLPRLLGLLRDSYDDSTDYTLTALIERLCSVDLLHIDDVGAEQTSPWVLEQLYTIINTRYEDARSIMVTTNLYEPEASRAEHARGAVHDGLEPLRDQIGARTVSRLQEMCGEVHEMFGHDHRQDAAFNIPVAGPEAELPYGAPRARPFRAA